MPGVLSLNGAPQLVLGDAGRGDSHVIEEASACVAGASTQRVMQLLGAQIRIKITDGRVVLGKFHCFDKHQNVILTDTREYLPLHRSKSTGTGKKGHHGKEKSKHHNHNQHHEPDAAEKEKEEAADEASGTWKRGTPRHLGMVLVPGKHIMYIKVERRVLHKD